MPKLSRTSTLALLGILSLCFLAIGLLFAWIGSVPFGPPSTSAPFSAVGVPHPSAEVRYVRIGLSLHSTFPGPYRPVHAQVTYPLDLQPGSAAQASLRLSFADDVVQVDPTQGVGNFPAEIAVPADPGNNYDDIYAEAQALEDPTIPVLWQLRTSSHQSLLKERAQGDTAPRTYRHEVDFTWRVYAINTGQEQIQRQDLARITFKVHWKARELEGEQSLSSAAVPILLEPPSLFQRLWAWALGAGVLGILTYVLIALGVVEKITKKLKQIVADLKAPSEKPRPRRPPKPRQGDAHQGD